MIKYKLYCRFRVDFVELWIGESDYLNQNCAKHERVDGIGAKKGMRGCAEK